MVADDPSALFDRRRQGPQILDLLSVFGVALRVLPCPGVLHVPLAVGVVVAFVAMYGLGPLSVPSGEQAILEPVLALVSLFGVRRGHRTGCGRSRVIIPALDTLVDGRTATCEIW